jgi:hypothetical protein
MATASQKQVARTANGQFRPGVSGNRSGNVHRSRHALNADTIREMHLAFCRGGRAAINKVMKQQPAVFLKRWCSWYLGKRSSSTRAGLRR